MKATGWRLGVKASLSLIVVLVLVTAIAQRSLATPRLRSIVAVDQGARPHGWVSIAFENVQVSVPPQWAVVPDGSSECGPEHGVVVLGKASWCPRGMNAPEAADTSVLHITTAQSRPPATPHMNINGIPVYTPDILPVYVVPDLEATLSFSGPPQPRVLHTLTYSPRAVALSHGPVPSVPGSWRWVTYAGVRLAVPSGWPVTREVHATSCESDWTLPHAGVTLAAESPLPDSCPAPPFGANIPAEAGVEIDAFGFNPYVVYSACTGPRAINGLSTCIERSEPYSDPYGVLAVVAQPKSGDYVTIRIGMTGKGLVGRTILYSMRHASSE